MLQENEKYEKNEKHINLNFTVGQRVANLQHVKQVVVGCSMLRLDRKAGRSGHDPVTRLNQSCGASSVPDSAALKPL